MVWHDDDDGDQRDVREDFQGDAILVENRGEERNNYEARGCSRQKEPHMHCRHGDGEEGVENE